MQLTKNFNINEFQCHDGTAVPFNLVSNVTLLAQNLQVLRDHIGEAIQINSGYRNPTYNDKIGGETDSQHIRAKAADIVARSYNPKQLAAVIEELIKKGKIMQGGLGIYPGFVHYDVRGFRARW